MSLMLGIRREDKNKWEKRTPVTPEHVKKLKDEHDINAIIQTSPIRIFKDKEYQSIGAQVQEDISNSVVIFAVKEIPLDLFEKNKTYVFFAHVIKGQKKNMPMLKKMMQQGCTLIDYEKITDDKGRRLVFFGRYAGLAGMVDSLWAFGQRMRWKGIKTPFSEIEQTINYKDLDEIKDHLNRVGNKIEKNGLNELIAPMVVGFAGYGNVSRGAQEIIDMLPIREIRPSQLEAIRENYSDKQIYKVVFKEEDMVEPISSEAEFDLQDYYKNPHLYRSVFQKYIPRLSILMNCIYWDERYPRLITKDFIEENYTLQMKLQVIGDISVDINGAIEFNVKTTDPGEPVYVYNPIREDIIEGFAGDGVAVLSVDNLPCEVPRESSKAFSESLMPFIPDIVKADYSVKFEKLKLPPEIKKAVVLYNGKLTPNYEYINRFL
jgi:saccharopine dehydrogenase (NAD+, L-lysine-forming)